MPPRYLLRLSIGFTMVAAMAAYGQKAEKTEKVAKPLGVIVQPVASRELQNNIEALGSLRANESTVITAKTTKTVSKIHFDDGQRVAKGDLLVEMLNTEESALMDEARFNAEEAKRQLDRSRSLAKSGAVSPAQLDQLTSEYTAARARFAAVESRFKDMSISAPFAGLVGLRNISVGSLIAPGDSLTTLNDDSKMKLDFTVPAVYLRSLRKGLSIEAQSADLGDKIFKGEVFSIDNQIDEDTRAIKVRAILDNAKHELTQGLLMAVVLHADVRKSLIVSESALVPMGSDTFVFVLRANKDAASSQWIAERRQIQIGQRYKGEVEVVSGLAEGEKVVTHGLQKIHAGQAVNILAEEGNDPAQKSETLAELLQQKNKEGK